MFSFVCLVAMYCVDLNSADNARGTLAAMEVSLRARLTRANSESDLPVYRELDQKDNTDLIMLSPRVLLKSPKCILRNMRQISLEEIFKKTDQKETQS